MLNGLSHSGTPHNVDFLGFSIYKIMSFVVMVGSSEITDRNLDVSEKNIKDFMEALQVAGQLSADNVLQTLKLLKVKILNNKMATPRCQKVTDIIVDYMKTMKPEGELEELCTEVLLALGFQSPGIVIFKLWDRWHLNNLPPNGLLVAVGRLIFCQGADPYIGVTWEYILHLLRMAQKEDDMLAVCHVLKGLVISARKHLDLGTKNDEMMDITQEALSIKAYLTLRVLFNRWSLRSNNKVTEETLVIIGHLFFLIPPSKLKNQVNRLTRWLMTLMSAKVAPFYISQCIFQLIDALALSGCGGINLESQLGNIIGMLFKQLSETVEDSNHHSVQNHSLALKAFYILTKLYNDRVVTLIRENVESKDPAKIVSTIQIFTDVLQKVPQTEQLKNEVMHSVIIMIQEDLKPVRRALLNFIEMLIQHDYLALPQGSIIINYVIKLSMSDCSNEEDIQLTCSKILQMVTLPKLITLVCQPSNTLAFVPLSKMATKMALRARSLGQVPYLSSFHLRPTQFISPQKLLTHLVAFLYKFLGFTLRTSRNIKMVQMMLSAILQTVHEELHEREELIREEPLNSISSSIRQRAMNFITNFRKLHPLTEVEERTELLQTCFQSVLCLPSTEDLQKEASSSQEAQATEDLLMETLQSLLRLMETLIVEMPSQIQYCLEHLNIWLNSQNDNERERAMWCAARILGFTAKWNNFGVEIKFSRLGCLVRLLAMRCQDPVDNICFLSSQAVYNLYRILLLQKQMQRKKQGLWEEEGKSEVYSANVFYNNTFEIAKAFAEYFTEMQLTHLVLTAMEGLTDSKATVSLAAAQLMSAVMKERGRDMIKIEEIVEGIVGRLNLQLEPNTKEETMRAMCLLAGNNTHRVVPMLLNKTLPWDRTNLALWKAFGTRRETTISVLQLLIGILEKLHSREESREMAFQPVAVTCALCEMLSGSLCQEAVQELYPRLLLAILHHLYWVIEQNVPQKMVVYNREEGPGRKSKPFDPTSCALEVVKLVFVAAAYEGVVVYANQHHCWDLLSSPKCYYIGIMDLTSGIVKNCEPAILHRILNLIRNILYSSNYHRRILARTFYAQLLWHRSVAQTVGQDFLGNLIKWTNEPNIIMKEVGLRGISNLALHPGQSESLKSQVPFLRDFLKNEARVTMQAVKSLRNIICFGKQQNTKVVFCSISKQLRPLINDERDLVKISATSALGHMLHRVHKFKPGAITRREIYSFLVPLLLSIQDNNTEVVKACGGALTEWTKVIGWSSLTQTFQHTTLSDHIQVLEETCKYLVGTKKIQLVGEFLSQSFDFLTSPQSFLREAAINFIGLTIKRLTMKRIHEDDVELLQNAIGSLRNDPVESIQSLVTTTLKNLDEYLNPESISASRMSQLSNNIFKVTGMKTSERKKRLFKTVKQERDDDDNQKKNIWNWLRGPLNSLCNWHNRRVKTTPLIIGNSDK
ncbi:maestro heat-like repeat-containing protein family member 7 isoform X7 [Panthera pardus]|uniref:Maestro heat-like repeat-containing protein family member 7 isoform X7 n=1 Tax=Panthera pardus TaxID=9691 RepID=A0A9W2UX82_PANPR|nr:maestro heat-like repeat-containing protein family member 7 isoform X7 [Panthera pardus]